MSKNKGRIWVRRAGFNEYKIHTTEPQPQRSYYKGSWSWPMAGVSWVREDFARRVLGTYHGRDHLYEYDLDTGKLLCVWVPS